MKIIKSKDLDNSFFQYKRLEKQDIVKTILNEIKNQGDIAIKKYTKKFDNVNLDVIKVSKRDIKDAYKKVPKRIINIIKKTERNIKKFAKEQYKSYRNFEVKISGNIIGQKIIPLESVGCYIPGGKYPLVSTALMNIVPAKIAGVRKIIVCSPKVNPYIIVAADIAGADEIFNIGGIQAIGAMAYGTKSVPKVNKIIGPGNKYVTLAKKEVFGEVGIDFIAGPSEVLIIADKNAKAEFIAADLLAQAEHDIDAIANLITTSKQIAIRVNQQLKIQLKKLKTKEIAKKALKNGKIIFVKSLDESIKISNKIAPEHLEIFIKNPSKIKDKLINYGSLFLGEYSGEVFGDYGSGTNHILPTNMAAKYTGGLSVKDFIKILTYQKINKNPSESIKIAIELAELEGLEAHKKAAEIRRKNGINKFK